MIEVLFLEVLLLLLVFMCAGKDTDKLGKLMLSILIFVFNINGVGIVLYAQVDAQSVLVFLDE